jgi:rhodanese-related sulfurtransferase
MNEPSRPDDPKSSSALFRDVAMLLLVGAVLGVTHNWFMLQAGPGKGLAWIKEERKVVRLEDVMPPDSPPSPPVAEAAAPPAAAGAPATAAKADSAARHAKASPGSADAKQANAKTAAPAVTPAPAASAPAPAAATPAPAAPSAPAADVPVIPESREPMETGLAIVRKLHAANAAVFVDARSAAEYAEGHIAGAVNLPFDDVFKKPDLVNKIDDRGLPIVCYCGGGDCDLSRNLAFSFLDARKKRVLVFVGGLPEWKDAALPVRTGSEP